MASFSGTSSAPSAVRPASAQAQRPGAHAGPEPYARGQELPSLGHVFHPYGRFGRKAGRTGRLAQVHAASGGDPNRGLEVDEIVRLCARVRGADAHAEPAHGFGRDASRRTGRCGKRDSGHQDHRAAERRQAAASLLGAAPPMPVPGR